MKFIKFIATGIIEGFNAMVGRGRPGTLKMSLVGDLALILMGMVFMLFWFILDRKTDLNYKTNILLSILFTILVIGAVALCAIVIEKIFNI